MTLPCGIDDSSSQSVIAFWVNPEAPDPVYAFLGLLIGHVDVRQVLASTDRGATWRQLPLSNPRLLAVAPGDSRVLYVWEDLGGLKRSGDGGSTWQVVHATPNASDGYFSLAVDPRDPDTIYLSTSHAVLRSRDGGRTQEVLDPSFIDVELTTDRTHPGLLFGRSVPDGLLFELPVE